MGIQRSRQWAIGLGFLGCGIALAVVNLGLIGPPLPLPVRIAFAAGGLALGWFLVGRVALAGVQVREDGLVVRNPFVRRLLPWSEIAGFSLGRYAAFTGLGLASLRDGSRVPLFGIRAVESAFNPGDRQAQRLIESLNAALAAHAG